MFSLRKKNNARWGILIVLILFLVYPATAQAIPTSVDEALLDLLSVIFQFVGTAIIKMTEWLGVVLKFPVNNLAIVQAGWTIMRNFANMFFIVGLIVMAFGTIFQVGFLKGYNFNSMIIGFLIAALLINFSLVLGNLVINGTQVFNNIMLHAMGSIGDKLANGLNPANLIGGIKPSDSGFTVELGKDITGQLVISIIFSLILLTSFAISLLTAFVFALIRIPFIWILLILSPLAVTATIFPATKAYFDKWWKEFIAWNLFLPIFLFSLYFALYFLGKQGDFIKEATNLSATVTATSIKLNSITLQTIFFYALVCLFLIGGPLMARSVSGVGGTWAGKAVGWAGNTAGGIMRAPLKLPYVKQAPEAFKARVEQAKKEGIFGIGGTEAERKRIERLKGAFGVKGFEADKLHARDTREQMKKYEESDTSIEDLRKAMRDQGNMTKASAAAELLLKKKRLTPQEISDFLPKYADFSKAGSKAFTGRTQDYVMDQLGKGNIKDELGIRQALELFKDAERADRDRAVKKAKQTALTATLNAQLDMGQLKRPDGTEITAEQAKTMTPEDKQKIIAPLFKGELALLPTDDLLKLSKNELASNAVQEFLVENKSPEALVRLASKAPAEKKAVFEATHGVVHAKKQAFLLDKELSAARKASKGGEIESVREAAKEFAETGTKIRDEIQKLTAQNTADKNEYKKLTTSAARLQTLQDNYAVTTDPAELKNIEKEITNMGVDINKIDEQAAGFQKLASEINNRVGRRDSQITEKTAEIQRRANRVKNVKLSAERDIKRLENKVSKAQTAVQEAEKKLKSAS